MKGLSRPSRSCPGPGGPREEKTGGERPGEWSGGGRPRADVRAEASARRGAPSPGKRVPGPGLPGRRWGGRAGAHVEAESRAALKPAASWQRGPASTLEAAAFGRGVAVWRGGAVGAGSGGPASQRVPAKQSGGPPSGALSWGFHPSGTGPGQRPRAGQGPSRGPASVLLPCASPQPEAGGGGGLRPLCPCPRGCLQPHSLVDPGRSCVPARIQ